MTITNKQLNLAFDNMKIRKDPTGKMPLIVVVPRDAIPMDTPGTITIAEAGAKAMRLGVEDHFAELAAAEAGGDAHEIDEAMSAASEMLEMWLAIELSFAGVLLKHGKKLKGRSMIAVK